jgi:Fe-S-cluster containining protein
LSIENKSLRLELSDLIGYAACMNPFLTLQRNAEDFFDQIQSRHASKMACQSGCAKCCYAEFSVFLGEALVIYEWFTGLTHDEKTVISAVWAKTASANACAFLRDERCSIYSARPIICRTQGAPLSFSAEKKKEVTKTVDCCPLNFDQRESIPKSSADWFDLDRLTALQGIAEHFTVKNFEIPESLRALIDSNQRVSLRKLQQLLAITVV